MRSAVAEAAKAEDRELVRRLSPSERFALSLRLGDEAVARFAESRGLTLEAARNELRDRAELARRKSRSRLLGS